MDRLIHTSASALRAAMARQSATANNIANASTIGFKAEMASVQPLWLKGEKALDTRVLASEQVLAADMKAGTVTQTGRSLDVALKGDALLAVQAPDGTEAYTRRGDLMLSDSGLLTTGDGTPVLGDSGPITLPPSDALEIDGTGAIYIRPTGADPAQPLQKIEQLKLVSPKGSQIAKGLDTLFRQKDGGNLPSDPDARLTSGSLEGSNVNASQALIDMIEASRAWENQIKLVSTAKEIDTGTADLMRVD
jgi:flagellar basal-body rod protein FlgF